MIQQADIESVIIQRTQKNTSYVQSLLKCMCEALQTALNLTREVQVPGFGTFLPTTSDGKPIPIADRANLVKDTADRMMETRLDIIENSINIFSELCREAVIRGDKVVMESLGTFELKTLKPHVEKTSKGHNIIRPGATIVLFTPVLKTGVNSVIFMPDDDIKDQLKKTKRATVLLAMPERDFFVDTLHYYFSKAGWNVELATDAKTCMDRVKVNSVSLLIIDATLHEHENITKQVKLVQRTAHIPLIVLFPTTQSLQSPPDVKIIGDINLAQPFEVRRLLIDAEREVLRAAEEELFIKQTVNLLLPTDERCMERSSEIIGKLLEESGLDEEKQVAVLTAFREAQLNAAQHGNTYKKTLPIEIQYILDSTKVTIMVRDKGTGFDYNFYLSTGRTRDAVSTARLRRAQGRMGGLGIMLMLRCADEITYSKNGNQLTLVKYLKKPG